MSDNVRMSNAPVYYVLAQIKFTPVKAMKKYVDDIQDALRLQGYPIFESRESTQLKFEFNTPTEPAQPAFEMVYVGLETYLRVCFRKRFHHISYNRIRYTPTVYQRVNEGFGGCVGTS